MQDGLVGFTCSSHHVREHRSTAAPPTLLLESLSDAGDRTGFQQIIFYLNECHS